MIRTRVARPEELEGETPKVNLDFYALRLLAEGDSWFSLGSIPPKNLLQELQFEESSVVVNLAYPGDEVQKMFRRMCDYGAEFANWLTMRSTWRFDAILLSGGGNDLIAALPHLIRRDVPAAEVDPAHPERFVDEAAMRKLEGYLVESFTGFVNLRDRPGSPNAGVPMFVHTYDYPTPNDAPALGPLGIKLGGPWILPRVRDVVPTELWQPLTRLLIDRVATTLMSLTTRLSQLHVIDTRGTLVPAALGATRESGDWENEIHPSAGGHRKLAAKLASAVHRRLEL
jgi:lysophospholipase L1-like esterase